jgi:hypothetical protein
MKGSFLEITGKGKDPVFENVSISPIHFVDEDM